MMNVGTDGFAIIDGKIIPFKIEFVGKDSYLTTSKDSEGKTIHIECPFGSFDTCEENLKKKMKTDLLAIIAREESKSGKKTIAYLIDMEFSPSLKHALNLRSRYNPELRYFIAMKNLVDDNFLNRVINDCDKMLEERYIIEA